MKIKKPEAGEGDRQGGAGQAGRAALLGAGGLGHPAVESWERTFLAEGASTGALRRVSSCPQQSSQWGWGRMWGRGWWRVAGGKWGLFDGLCSALGKGYEATQGQVKCRIKRLWPHTRG